MPTATHAPHFTPREWNASGAIHCYGKDLRTFVVEVVTTEPIQGEPLQQALDRALERLPYYSWTLVRKKDLF